MKGRAVFMDRDGVLNRSILRDGQPCPPDDCQSLELLPGAPAACQMLKRAGYRLLVVTNQPDVARGTQTRQQVDQINAVIKDQTHVDAIYVCYHDDSDHCVCRKPAPGLILEAARQWDIEPAASFMIGDRPKDIEAGHRAGCRTILIESDDAEPETAIPDYRAGSLLEAVGLLLSRYEILV